MREKNPVAAVEPPGPKTVLHVGCGTAPLPAGLFDGMNEVRLDIDPAVNPDVVGSITDIPLLSGVVDAIYSSHNIEHLAEHEVPKAFSEFYRVLKPGGKIIIEVPDVQSVAESIPKIGLNGVLYESPAGPISPADVLYGLRSAVAGGNEFYAHKMAFTRDTLESSLKKAQFKKVNVDRNVEAFALIANATRP
jgi:ubiquinone/menaquinone biosynthesis C-methylase UbiE